MQSTNPIESIHPNIQRREIYAGAYEHMMPIFDAVIRGEKLPQIESKGLTQEGAQIIERVKESLEESEVWGKEFIQQAQATGFEGKPSEWDAAKLLTGFLGYLIDEEEYPTKVNFNEPLGVLEFKVKNFPKLYNYLTKKYDITLEQETSGSDTIWGTKYPIQTRQPSKRTAYGSYSIKTHDTVGDEIPIIIVDAGKEHDHVLKHERMHRASEVFLTEQKKVSGEQYWKEKLEVKTLPDPADVYEFILIKAYAEHTDDMEQELVKNYLSYLSDIFLETARDEIVTDFEATGGSYEHVYNVRKAGSSYDHFYSFFKDAIQEMPEWAQQAIVDERETYFDTLHKHTNLFLHTADAIEYFNSTSATKALAGMANIDRIPLWERRLRQLFSEERVCYDLLQSVCVNPESESPSNVHTVKEKVARLLENPDTRELAVETTRQFVEEL